MEDKKEKPASTNINWGIRTSTNSTQSIEK